MRKRRKTQLDAGDLSEELARQFLPPPLNERCLVVPLRLLKYGGLNIIFIGLFLGLLLGGLLARVLTPGQISWIGMVSLAIPLLIAKFVLGPIENRFELEARDAAADAEPDPNE